MPRSRLRIVVLEGGTTRRRTLVQLLEGRPGTVTARSRSSSVERVLEREGADLLLVPACHPDRTRLLRIAERAGLEVELLFQPQEGHLYLARARFGSHKWALRLLGACGEWWELRHRESSIHDRYRKLLNRVGDGLVDLDAQDVIRWANDAFRRTLGNDVVGRPLEELIDPEDVARLRTLRQQHQSGVVIPFAVRLQNGQTVELDPSLRFNEKGELIGSSLVLKGVHRESSEGERARELFTLYSVATVLSQSREIEGALRQVLDRVLELMNFAAGGVVLEGGRRRIESNRDFPLRPEAVELLLELGCTDGDGKATAIRDTAAEDGPLRDLGAHGIRGLGAIPLRSGGQEFGVLWFVSSHSGHFSREVVSLLISIASQVAVAVERARHLQSLLQEEAGRRQFYRDALQAITRGKLILCEPAELDEVWRRSDRGLGRLVVADASGVPAARSLVESALRDEGFAEDRCYEMALCASEAVANMVKHAQGGNLEIAADPAVVRVRVEDRGPGIDFAHLPNAVLTPGFSTAPSLGMGYSILLELADCIHLSTGEGGTTVLLEAAREKADPLEAFVGLMAEEF
ncbi:MAG: ATP-binding protein [Armatimonadetes bacterium]|nr:ATP-binding protein [Armatimonadota bacterium]